MKKLLPVLAVALMIFTGACKKSETAATVSGDNSWTLGSTTYKATISNKSTTSSSTPMTLIYFWDAVPTTDLKVNSVALSFKEAPTTSGTYQLVGIGAATSAGKFELSAGTHTVAYAYIGASVDVTVTVTGGKVKVVIPEITVKSTVSGQPDVKLSGTVHEI